MLNAALSHVFGAGAQSTFLCIVLSMIPLCVLEEPIDAIIVSSSGVVISVHTGLTLTHDQTPKQSAPPPQTVDWPGYTGTCL